MTDTTGIAEHGTQVAGNGSAGRQAGARSAKRSRCRPSATRWRRSCRPRARTPPRLSFHSARLFRSSLPSGLRHARFILEFGLTDRHYFGNAQFDGTLAYRQGIGAFGAQDDSLAGDGDQTYRYKMAVLDANLSVPFAIGKQPFRYVGTFHGLYTGNTLHYIDDLTIGSRYTVRGFDGETMLAAARGFYWRNELQAPIGQTGQAVYAASTTAACGARSRSHSSARNWRVP
ncbi:HlyB family hemolysin activator protein [Burkholderia metallica]|nr:HlyB family hemolysin activator protein [Burkholderia metallica]